MKTKILFSTLFLLIFFTTNAQQWEAVGPDDDKQASSSASAYSNLVFDSSGNPFVAYNESLTKSTTESFGTVKKFNGSAWEYVGMRGFTGDIPYYFTLALDNLDTPYVVYGDYLNSKKAVVKKFNGSNWESVGDPEGFSNGRVLFISMAINSSGTPYVAYKDLNSNGTFTNVVKKFDRSKSKWEDVSENQFSIENPNSIQILFDSSDNLFIAFVSTSGYKPTVKMLDGTDWIDIGTPKFSDGQIDYLSFNIDSSDALYVSYADSNIGYKPMVKKFDGTDWVVVGQPGFSIGSAEYTSIGFDDSSIPYIAYHDTGNGSIRGMSVQKFNGTQWVDVGTPGFSLGDASGIKLSFNNSGIPLVAYIDDIENYKLIVKKFDGSNWIDVGPRGFSKGRAFYLDLKTDSNNNPYAAFQDEGFFPFPPAYVKMFDGNEWITVGDSQVSGNNKTAEYLSLALSNNNTPYLAYRENNPYKIAVKRLNGNTWENLSNNEVYQYDSSQIDIEFNSSNTLFIAYKGDFLKPTVKMFDGGNWVLVGSSGLSTGIASQIQLIIDSMDNIYVAYLDSALSWGLVVKTFDGSQWVDLGTPGFINNGTFFISVGPDNLPVVASLVSDSVIIMKFDGSDWVNKGSLNVPNRSHLYSLSVDANNAAYVSYTEDPGEGRLQIKKLEQNNWIEVGSKTVSSGNVYDAKTQFDNLGNLFVVYENPDLFSKKFATGVLSTPNFKTENSNVLIYPNPVRDNFKILSNQLNINNIKIFNYNGRLVKTINWKKEEANLNNLAPGMYILQIKTEEGTTVSRKMIKI